MLLLEINSFIILTVYSKGSISKYKIIIMPNSIRNYIDFNIKPCHQSHSPIFFPFGQEASLALKNSVDSYLSRIISLLTLSAKYIFGLLSFPLRYEPSLGRLRLPHCPAVAEYPKRHSQPFVQAHG